MAGNKKDYRTGRRAVYNLKAHIVLTPIYMKEVFNNTVKTSCEESFKHICDKFKVELVDFNTDDDHAHLIVNCPPSINLSSFIGQLKGYSSRVLRRDFYDEIEEMLWGDHFWSPSYLIVSTGDTHLEIIREYVRKQGEEPRKPGNPNLMK